MQVDGVRKAAEVGAIRRRHRELRLDAGVPLPVHEQSFLRREAEITLLPFAIPQHTKLFEQLPDECRAWAWNGDIVRGPRVGRDVVLTGTCVTARSRPELQQGEVAHAAAVELPSRRQTGDAGANDRNVHAKAFARRGRPLSVAKRVADAHPVVDEAASDCSRCLSR